MIPGDWTPYAAGLGAAAALMVLVWLGSLVKRDVSIVDTFWGAGFVVAGWVYFLLTDGAAARKLLAVTLVTLWGLRLSVYIFWRARGTGEDYRYRAMRESWGPRFAWVSLFTVFLLQAAILWVVSAPLFQAQRSPEPVSLGPFDVVGVVLFGIGLLFESVGDLQLARFKADPRNKGRVLDRGLWRYTRHPNYFGDAVVWWGLSAIALATPGSWWILVSPVVMTTLLMKVSGVALLERNLVDTKPAYRDYVARTPAFFPWFPRQR